MRLDKPIGILLLLWPTLWGLWLCVPRLAESVDHRWFSCSAWCSCGRPVASINDFADRKFDPPCRAHQGPAAGRAADSPKEALLLAAVLSLLAFLLVLQLNCADHRAFGRGARAGGDLSVPQALFLAAAGMARHCVRFRHPDGVRRASRPDRAAGLGAAAREHILGDRLRHRICDGRPRRRHQARPQVVGDICSGVSTLRP